jgi:putative phosphoribosyl transferase
MFQDRLDAGNQLAVELRKYRNEPGVILAVPRGGVPVAYAVARTLGFPVNLVLTKKIGHPANKEFAIGAANLTEYFVDPRHHVPEEYIQREVKRVRNRLRMMYNQSLNYKQPADLRGNTVIIIDDGIATGNTILGTIQLMLKSEPAKIVVATPVASQSAVDKLSKYVDEMIVLIIPHQFMGVGAYYHDFTQVSDEAVKLFLDESNAFSKTG